MSFIYIAGPCKGLLSRVFNKTQLILSWSVTKSWNSYIAGTRMLVLDMSYSFLLDFQEQLDSSVTEKGAELPIKGGCDSRITRQGCLHGQFWLWIKGQAVHTSASGQVSHVAWPSLGHQHCTVGAQFEMSDSRCPTVVTYIGSHLFIFVLHFFLTLSKSTQEKSSKASGALCWCMDHLISIPKMPHFGNIL